MEGQPAQKMICRNLKERRHGFGAGLRRNIAGVVSRPEHFRLRAAAGPQGLAHARHVHPLSFSLLNGLHQRTPRRWHCHGHFVRARLCILFTTRQAHIRRYCTSWHGHIGSAGCCHRHFAEIIRSQAQVWPTIQDVLRQTLHSAHAIGKQAVDTVRKHACTIILTKNDIRQIVIPVREKDRERIALRLQQGLSVGGT